MERGFLNIGLLNNGTGRALEQFERMFDQMIKRALYPVPVAVHKIYLTSVSRSSKDYKYLQNNRYMPFHHARNLNFDVMIITGAIPRSKKIQDERFFPELIKCFDELAQRRVPSIFSCLAAHCAVLYFDGIVRTRRNKKISGIFDHQLADCVGKRNVGTPNFFAPHSRWHDVSRSDLENAGYEVLVSSEIAGVFCALRSRGFPTLFLQGHPEYQHHTLLDEYQRDMIAFKMGKLRSPPDYPVGYDQASEEQHSVSSSDQKKISKRQFSLPFGPFTLRPAPWEPGFRTVLRYWLAGSIDTDTITAGKSS